MKQKRRGKDAKLVHEAANRRNLETGELGLAKNAIWSLFWLGKNNEKQRTWAHRENAHPKERCKSAVKHSAPNLLDRLLRQNGVFFWSFP